MKAKATVWTAAGTPLASQIIEVDPSMALPVDTPLHKATVAPGDTLTVASPGIPSATFTFTHGGSVISMTIEPDPKFKYGDVVANGDGRKFMVIGESSGDEFDWEITPLEEGEFMSPGEVYGYEDDELALVP